MKLIQRPNIGQGVHRAGWVSVMGALYKEADGKGMLLDDCVEYSFLFGPNRNRPHVELRLWIVLDIGGKNLTHHHPS